MKTANDLRVHLTLGRAMLWATVLAGICSPIQSAVFTVGAGSDCTSSSISLALIGAGLTPEDDEIRISAGVITGVDVDLVNWNPSSLGALTIRGGYSTCSEPTASGRTILEADPSGPIFHIRHDPASSSIVTLDRLILSGANNSHALVVEGDGAEVTLDWIDIIQSDGGLHLLDDALAELSRLTLVTSNDVGTGSGGGILCETGSYLTTAALVSNNSAGTGGGLFAASDCDVVLRPGAAFTNNEALFGGGAAVRDSGTSIVALGSTPGNSIRFDSNHSATRGGGLWINFGAVVVVLETQITNNTAHEKGGGIYVDGGAGFFMARGDSVCATAPRCSVLSDNQLGSEDEGIAVWAGGNADVTIQQTYIEGNSTPGRSAPALFATDQAVLNLASVQIWNNSTSTLFTAFNGATIDATGVSAFLNRWLVLPTSEIDSRGAFADSGSTISIDSSILQTHSEFISSGGSQVSADCTYLESEAGLDGATSNIVGTNPGFLFGGIGDLRLYANAVTVDECADTTPVRGATPTFDLLHQPREHDEPGVPNPPTFIRDMGAFEAWGLFFADGFETGSVSRWSDSVP